MLQKKIFLMCLICFGLFLFSVNDSSAQTKRETLLGYPFIGYEGNLEYAELIAMPDSNERVANLGEFSELSKEFIDCFNKAIEYQLELEITGNVMTDTSGYKFLRFDNSTTCSHRN